jgi:hypothetical protein
MIDCGVERRNDAHGNRPEVLVRQSSSVASSSPDDQPGARIAAARHPWPQTGQSGQHARATLVDEQRSIVPHGQRWVLALSAIRTAMSTSALVDEDVADAVEVLDHGHRRLSATLIRPLLPRG